MKDKNGVEIKEGDKIRSKGKFEYIIITVRGELVARGVNLKHTDKLSNLDLAQIEVI